MNELETVSTTAVLAKEGNDLTDAIVNERDPDKVKKLTDLFLMNQTKKNIVRIGKLSQLLELVDDEVLMRFVDNPEDFDNELLLKYSTNTQRALNELTQAMKEQPIVQVNNEININDSGLNRESRQKVLEVVAEIMNNIKDVEYEVEE